MRKRDSLGVGDGHIYNAVFKMDNQEGPTVEHREVCSKSCGILDGREVWGRMDTCICTAESLHNIINWLILPIQKMFKVKKIE